MTNPAIQQLQQRALAKAKAVLESQELDLIAVLDLREQWSWGYIWIVPGSVDTEFERQKAGSILLGSECSFSLKGDAQTESIEQRAALMQELCQEINAEIQTFMSQTPDEREIIDSAIKGGTHDSNHQ